MRDRRVVLVGEVLDRLESQMFRISLRVSVAKTLFKAAETVKTNVSAQLEVMPFSPPFSELFLLCFSNFVFRVSLFTLFSRCICCTRLFLASFPLQNRASFFDKSPFSPLKRKTM